MTKTRILTIILLGAALLAEGCSKLKDYSVTPSGQPVRQPDLVAYYSREPTEEEHKSFVPNMLSETGITRDVFQRASSGRMVLEIWFERRTTDEEKEKIRQFLKSHPLVERIEEND